MPQGGYKSSFLAGIYSVSVSAHPECRPPQEVVIMEPIPCQPVKLAGQSDTHQVGPASAHAGRPAKWLKAGPAAGIEDAEPDVVQECTDGVLAGKSARHKRGNCCHDLDVGVEGLYGRKSRRGRALQSGFPPCTQQPRPRLPGTQRCRTSYPPSSRELRAGHGDPGQSRVMASKSRLVADKATRRSLTNQFTQQSTSALGVKPPRPASCKMSGRAPSVSPNRGCTVFVAGIKGQGLPLDTHSYTHTH